MKITTSKLELIQNKVKGYCSALNVDVPKVVVTKPDYDFWKIQRRNEMGHGMFGRPSTDRLGATHRKDKVIFINTSRIRNLATLDETICTQLIRLAKPSYNINSPEFKDRKKRLQQGKVRNGRFFKENKNQENGQHVHKPVVVAAETVAAVEA
jgi:hypothetical protein